MNKLMRRVICLALIVCFAASWSASACAESFTQDVYTVTFDGKKMTETYEGVIDLEENIQPGDDLTQVITLKNSSTLTADWYIENEVLKSLEANSKRDARGGSYRYKLTYTSAKDNRVLYDSDLVGGETDANEGMVSATKGLENYVFLGEIPAGGTATVTLFMAVDGRSQINRYQDTDAKVRMRFAVETKTDKKVIKSVKTGDWIRTAPFIVLTALSGIMLLGMALIWVRKPKKADGRR